MPEDTAGGSGPFIDELLCFVVNKMDTLDVESLVRLCSETYSENDTKVSKDLVFGLLHNESDSTKLINRRNSKLSESIKVKNIRDILQLLQEKGTADLPQFVALDLGNLPPITFDHIDVTALLSQIENTKTKIDILQSAVQQQNVVSDALAETNMALGNRVARIEKLHEKQNVNTPNTANNELNTSFECKECVHKCAFNSKEELDIHLELHKKATYPCPECDHKSSSKEDHDIHMVIHKREFE